MILTMTMYIKIKKKNLCFYFFCICVACELQYFYLIDSNKLNIAGIFNISDCALILSMFWGCYTWFKLSKLPNYKFKYKFWMIGIIILSIISSYQSQNLYNQPILMGIRPQRELIVWALLYFPLSKAMHYNKITKEQLLKMINVIGTIELLLFITQYIIGGRYQLLYTSVTSRYGDARYFYQVILLDLLLFIKLDDLFFKKNKIKSIIYILAILFEVMIVQKYRMTTVGLIATTIFMILIMRRKFGFKYWIFALMIIGGYFLLQTQMSNDIIKSILFGDENLTIRSIGRQYYFSRLSTNPIWGCGFPSTLNYVASEAAGYNNMIYTVDNGVFGLLYIYGLLGAIWFVSLWIKFLKSGLEIYMSKMKTEYFLAFPVFLLTTMQSEAHWYWDGGFMVLTIFICMLENTFNKIREKK